jgi:hypothetical protein
VTQSDLDELHRATLTEGFPLVLSEITDRGLLVFLLESDKELLPAIIERFPPECGTELSIWSLEDCQCRSFADDTEWISFIATHIAQARREEGEQPPKALLFDDFRLLLWAYPDQCEISIYPTNPNLTRVAQPAVALAKGLEAPVLIESSRGFLQVRADLSAAAIANGNDDDWGAEQPLRGEIQGDFLRLAMELAQGPRGLQQLLGGSESSAETIRFFQDDQEIYLDRLPDHPWTGRMREVELALRAWSPGQGLPAYTTIVDYGGTLSYARDGWRIELII